MTVTSASGITDYTVQGNNVTQTTDTNQKPLSTDSTGIQETAKATEKITGQTAIQETTGLGNEAKTAAVKEQKQDDKKGQASNEALKDAVNKINKSRANTEAVFGIHDKTHRVTIKIIDKDTRKVIREFPPEKTLDLIAKVWEMAGILVDEKR